MGMIESLLAGDYRGVTAENLPELIGEVIAHDWQGTRCAGVADALFHFCDENTSGPRSAYGRARESIRRGHDPGDHEGVSMGGLELYILLCEAAGVAPYIDTNVHPSEYWP